MLEVTQEQVIAALHKLGIGPGDGLLVHAAVQFLGRSPGGAQVYYQAICNVIGLSGYEDRHPDTGTPVGTLVVPAFNFGFARGEPFDPQETPSQGMGVFAEYVRQQPGARRTPHPLQSLAAIGPYAEDLAGRDTLSAFDPGSAFERMLELGFKLLLLGADVQAVSAVHYSEQRAAVPYRYWKDFQGKVRTNAGWEQRTYRMFVRDLGLNPHLDLRPIQAVMQARNQWTTVPINYGSVSSCRISDFVAAANRLLAADPWALVSNRAQINAGSR